VGYGIFTFLHCTWIVEFHSAIFSQFSFFFQISKKVSLFLVTNKSRGLVRKIMKSRDRTQIGK
jgi:hypothetical protein